MKYMRKTHNFEWPISGFSVWPSNPLCARKYPQGKTAKMRIQNDHDAKHQLLIAGIPSHLLLASNTFSGAVLDEHGRFLDVNHSAAELFSCGRDKLQDKSLFRWLVAGEDAKFMAFIRQIFRMQNNDMVMTELLIKSDDGRVRLLRLECARNGMPEAARHSCLVTMADMTDLKNARQSRWLSEHLFNEVQEGVIVMDNRGVIQSVNRAFKQATGYTEADVIGKTLVALKPDHSDEAFYREMWKVIKEAGEWHGEIWSHRKSGEAYPVWLSIKAVPNDSQTVFQYLGTFADISVTGATLERLQYLAYYDALTGLPNRRLFIDRFNSALTQARRNGMLMAVMFMDLDDFKVVNDTRGHSVGDRLLVMAAARFKECLREEDTIARFGGDEFTVILPQLPHSDAAASVAMKIQQSFSRPFVIDGIELSVTVSTGISIYPNDGERSGELLGHADTAMYQAKMNSHNAFGFYGQESRSQ